MNNYNINNVILILLSLINISTWISSQDFFLPPQNIFKKPTKKKSQDLQKKNSKIHFRTLCIFFILEAEWVKFFSFLKNYISWTKNLQKSENWFFFRFRILSINFYRKMEMALLSFLLYWNAGSKTRRLFSLWFQNSFSKVHFILDYATRNAMMKARCI